MSRTRFAGEKATKGVMMKKAALLFLVVVIIVGSTLFIGCGTTNVVGIYEGYEGAVTLELRQDGTAIEKTAVIQLKPEAKDDPYLQTDQLGGDEQEGTYRVAGDTVIFSPNGMSIEYNFTITDGGLVNQLGVDYIKK